MISVGISTSLIKSKITDTLSLDYGYFNQVKDMGALPIMFPILKTRDEARQLIDMVDMLILTGGVDVSPFLYEKNPCTIEDYQTQRDNFEILLFEEARKKQIPIMGICRGLQLVNVCMGGSLYTDLKNSGMKEVIHSRELIPEDGPMEVYHLVETVEDSCFREFAGETLVVNSIHHQGIKELGRDLVASAHSADGLIEAVESKDLKFIGFQFHPERMDSDLFSKAFKILMEAR